MCKFDVDEWTGHSSNFLLILTVIKLFLCDQQNVKFSSWTFNGGPFGLSFYADPWADLSDSKSGTWNIVEVPVVLNVYNNSKPPHQQHQQTSSSIPSDPTIPNRMTPSPTSVNIPPSPTSSSGGGQHHQHHLHGHGHPHHVYHSNHHQPISPRASKSDAESLEMSELGGSGPGLHPLPSPSPHPHSHPHPPHPPLPPPPSHLINSPTDLNISQSLYEQYGTSSPGHISPSNLNYRPNYLAGDQTGDRSAKTYRQHHYHNHHQIPAAQSSTTSHINRGKSIDREASADNQSIDMICLSSAASKATEAIEFIAEHLRAEDEYIQSNSNTLQIGTCL